MAEQGFRPIGRHPMHSDWQPGLPDVIPETTGRLCRGRFKSAGFAYQESEHWFQAPEDGDEPSAASAEATASHGRGLRRHWRRLWARLAN